MSGVVSVTPLHFLLDGQQRMHCCNMCVKWAVCYGTRMIEPAALSSLTLRFVRLFFLCFEK